MSISQPKIFNLSMVGIALWSAARKETNMAANNFYGFPHAGAQYGYMLICISTHVLYVENNRCSICRMFWCEWVWAFYRTGNIYKRSRKLISGLPEVGYEEGTGYECR